MRIPKSSLKRGLYCAVLTNYFWLRGIVLSIIETNLVEVSLIDFGEIMIVPRSHLRYLFEKFSGYPAQAIKGKLEVDKTEILNEIYDFSCLFRMKVKKWELDCAVLEYVAQTETPCKQYDFAELLSISNQDECW